MLDLRGINASTTLGELREQLLHLGVRSLNLYRPVDCGARAASLRHASGVHVGYGPTEATAIEDAFVKLRHALLKGCAPLDAPPGRSSSSSATRSSSSPAAQP